MFRHILVPIDGSPLSDSAVKKAVAFAKEINAKTTFFFAEPDKASSLINGDAALLQTIDPELLANNINKHILEVLGKARAVADDAGINCNVCSVVSNEPYEAIVDEAEKSKCDLILMASHGRRGVRGLLLGSQTQKVLVHSKIPVLVYR